jgi:hypothetical protein
VNAALLDLALHAPFLADDELRLVEEQRFDVRFLPELCLRLKEERQSGRVPTRECVQLALESVRDSHLAPSTDVVRALEYIGRAVEIQKVEAGEVVIKVIGADVRQNMLQETWDMLLGAELAWLSQDYTAMGVHYRRALEHEWRTRTPASLMRFVRSPRDRMGLGEIMHVLRNALTGGTIGRATVIQELGPTNPLLRGDVLWRITDICDTFLNEAAHVRGLDRSQGDALRGQLLADGLLRTWLSSVQHFSTSP